LKEKKLQCPLKHFKEKYSAIAYVVEWV